MEKWEIRNPLPQKPLNRSSPKFGPLPLCKISLRYDYPLSTKICENTHQVTPLVFWFFCQPTAETPTQIFTLNPSNDVFSRKYVPFGHSKTTFHILTPFSTKNVNFGAIFDVKFRVKGLNYRVLRAQKTQIWGHRRPPIYR